MQVNGPRKLPRQARSQATVEVLLDATAILLTAEGFAAATTTRVAEKAGVSIGSLYQYFPNREALVRALARRRDSAAQRAVQLVLEDTRGARLETVLMRSLKAMLAFHGSDLPLHRVLVQEAPRLGPMDWVTGADAHRYTVTRRMLGHHRAELRPGIDPDVAAFLVPDMIGAAIAATVVARPSAFASGALERELTDMLRSYMVAQ